MTEIDSLYLQVDRDTKNWEQEQMKSSTNTKQILGFEITVYDDSWSREIMITTKNKCNSVIVSSDFVDSENYWTAPKLRLMDYKDKTTEEIIEFSALMSFVVMLVSDFHSRFV